MIHCTYGRRRMQRGCFRVVLIRNVIRTWQCGEVVILLKSGIFFLNVRLYYTNIVYGCYIVACEITANLLKIIEAAQIA